MRIPPLQNEQARNAAGWVFPVGLAALCPGTVSPELTVLGGVGGGKRGLQQDQPSSESLPHVLEARLLSEALGRKF